MVSTAAYTNSAPPSPGTYSDDLAAVVVRRLEKRPGAGSWGLLKTVLLGVPSFGLLPLLAWPARFRDYTSNESQAFGELAQWSKLRGRQPAAIGPLLAAAEETAGSPLPFVLAMVLGILVIGVFSIQFAREPFTFDQLLNWTYRHRFGVHRIPPLPRGELLYRVWAIALSVGYAVQWFHVRAHAACVRRFIARFNPVAEAELLPPVQWVRGGWAYFRPMWVLTAFLLAAHGAWWGIPMVLAGMAQRRYTQLIGKRLRCDLAYRVKDIVAQRTAAPLLTLAAPGGRCANPRCMASVSSDARFCTRCGTGLSGGRPA